MLPLIFVSYGLVVVLINTVLLWTLAWIFTDRFHVEHFLWAFAGGLVCGLVEGLLQNMLGLTPPIVEGGPAALTEEIARRKHGLLEKELLAVTAEDTPELATDALDEDEDVSADRSRGGGS
jgi:H+/Cl- antiporter ClcA